MGEGRSQETLDSFSLQTSLDKDTEDQEDTAGEGKKISIYHILSMKGADVLFKLCVILHLSI